MKEIKIDTPYIPLGQLLKKMDCAQSGGEAKILLSEHLVTVNREKETRRGRKVYPQDVVSVKGYGHVRVKGGTSDAR